MTTEPVPTTNYAEEIEEATDPFTGRTYCLNHTIFTSSWEDPREHKPQTTYFTLIPAIPGIPYPFQRYFDKLGRACYSNRKPGATSWMNPIQLAELKEKGLLEGEVEEDGDLYGGTMGRHGGIGS